MITAMPRIAIAVNAFDDVVARFRHQFGMPVDELSETSVNALGAQLAMCVPRGGSNIELMCPAVEEAALAKSLRRFLDRRGEGLFALMLEADDPNLEAERLLSNGLNVLPLMEGAGGRDIHPNSTHGVLIRIYPNGSYVGDLPDTDESLGLSGIVRVEIAVRNLDAAREVYGAKMGLPVETVVTDAARGVDSVICRPPKGGVIELLTVRDTSVPFAAELDEFTSRRGEGMYAIVLRAPDVGAVKSALAERGVSVQAHEASGECLVANVSGAQIRIEAS